MPPTIRPATLADVPAISAIHVSDLVTWRRWDESGVEHIARYEDLTPFERWQNGGPWMDPVTLRPHIARLLAGAGHALVAEVDGEVRGEAEVYVGDEPPPWDRNLNLSVLYVRRGNAGRGVGSALMGALMDLAHREHCKTFMVTHAEAGGFYARHGLERWGTWRAAEVPVGESRTFYTAEPVGDWNYESVRGWGMPVGRYQSARQEWERLAPGALPGFPEWHRLQTERWQLTVRRSPAVLLLDEMPHGSPGTADVHLWTPDGSMSRQLLAAVRDRAARSGFTRLRVFMPEKSLPALGPHAEPGDYRQDVYGVRLSETHADRTQ